MVQPQIGRGSFSHHTRNSILVRVRGLRLGLGFTVRVRVWCKSGLSPTNGPRPVQEMFRDRTEVMLDWRGPGPGPGPVLALIKSDLPQSVTEFN